MADIHNAAVHPEGVQEQGYQENESIREQTEEYFPLTTIEKKLCGISFGLGVVLLAIFLTIFKL